MGKDARARQWSKAARGLGANALYVSAGETAEQGKLRVRTVRRRVLNATTDSMSVVTLVRAYVAIHQGTVSIADCIQWAHALPPEQRTWSRTFVAPKA